jgi:hypothetical protein
LSRERELSGTGGMVMWERDVLGKKKARDGVLR